MVQETSRARWKAAILAALCAALLTAALAWAPAEAAESPLCPSKAGPGFLNPLAKMPSLRKPPSSGKLPFGPAGLRLQARKPLRLGMGPVGYVLRLEGAARRHPPDWKLTERLARINPRGRVTEVLEARALDVASARGDGLAFTVRTFSDYYRVDIRVADSSGRTLGSYGAYFRVVEPTVNPQVRFHSRAVKAGESLIVRLVNLGTETVAEDNLWELERFDGTTFVPYLPGPAKGGPRVKLGLHDGAAGRCFTVPIPADAPPGKYQLGKVVYWPLPPDPEAGAGIYEEKFQVVP